jgi:hypothetical protein
LFFGGGAGSRANPALIRVAAEATLPGASPKRTHAPYRAWMKGRWLDRA